MRFLSKPTTYDVTKPQEYIEFSNFRLALTHRNWTGKKYATRKMGEAFLGELLELDNTFNDLIGAIDERLKLDFMLDVSVFANAPQDNTVLIEFLEELEDFYEEIDESDIERMKLKKNYLKKLRYYSSKLENSTYLYRWAYLNPDHPFSSDLIQSLNENIERYGAKVDKEYVKKNQTLLKSAIVEQIKEQMKKQKQIPGKLKMAMGIEDLSLQFKARYSIEAYELSSKPSSEFITKVFTYGLGEPTLFYFGLHALNLYFKQHDFHILKSRLFILFREVNNQTQASLLYSTPSYSDTYLNNEFLLKEFEERYVSQVVYGSITNMVIPPDLDLNESEKVDVLKTIAEWAIDRIDFNKLNQLPLSNTWIHHLPEDFLKEYGIKAISLRKAEVIGGPDGDECFVLGVAYDSSGHPFMFPIFDSNSWSELNSLQCAIIAYSICLIHDMLVDENYKLLPIEKKTITNIFDDSDIRHDYSVQVGFETVPLKKQKALIGKEKNETEIWLAHLDDEDRPQSSYNFHMGYLYDNELEINQSVHQIKKEPLKTEHSKKSGDTCSEEAKKRKEYWVSFHFRKLHPGQSASEEAKQKANQYGVKRIPTGFTFVSGHSRGEPTHQKGNLNIRALEVLNKTIGKMTNLEEIKN